MHMNPTEMILQGIRNVKLSPQSVAKADASITRSIGREVERAIRIANAATMWKGTGPVTPSERLACAKLTRMWEGLARDAETTIVVAIENSESYELAAQMIEQAVEGL
jgi:hypothetical protein